MRAHAREQLGQRERLDQVVDRAGVQSRDAILDLSARGQHDHRHARLGAAHRFEHLQAVATGQHQVEHDRVEVVAQRQALARDAVAGRLDREAGRLKAASHEVDDARLVLDQQDPRAREPPAGDRAGWPGPPPARARALPASCCNFASLGIASG